jgi:hypothetical protein
MDDRSQPKSGCWQTVSYVYRHAVAVNSRAVSQLTTQLLLSKPQKIMRQQ